MIDFNPSLVVLDVRTQSEYDSGHIRNSKLIPHTELEVRLDELKRTDEILVYCRTGVRSSLASQNLSDNGFLHVHNMLEGTVAWEDEGYPLYVKHSTIQEAINNAYDGDTIFVSSGIYNEQVIVNKSLTLVGENKDATTIDGTGNGTIFCVNADDVSISDFTLRLSGCACDGFCGIHVERDHHNVSITENHIVFNGFGIKLDWAQRVLIAYNNISNNVDWSIIISNSSNIKILENNMINNPYGILLKNSTEIVVSRNIFSSYSNYEILFEESNGNSIFQNTFTGSYNVYSLTSINFWDNGIEGNYWSNYAGGDLNYDGIGDSHFIVNENNTDRYPLMGMFSRFNTPPSHHVNIISNSTIDHFEYFGSNSTIKIYVSNMTTDQTLGFCRISIPHVLINETYKVTIHGAMPRHINYTIHDNGTYRWIYFSYEHSTLEIIIIHELMISSILPLFMMVTLVVAVIARRKHSI